jgi:hypothetical protein
MPDGSACYDYPATNTFSGRMKEYAVLTPKGKILINQPEVFNKFFANKSGEQLVASATEIQLQDCRQYSVRSARSHLGL